MKEKNELGLWPWQTPGIEDELFHRNRVPLTRAEVRSLVIAKSRLLPDNIVFDIGAGTGSVSIELARFLPGGLVYAVEEKQAALEAISANIKRFCANNIKIVAGQAPEVLAGLPRPDRVFVGGSGGRLKAILQFCQEHLPVGGRVIINALTVSTLAQALEFFNSVSWPLEACQVSVARLTILGSNQAFRPLDGIYLLAATKSQSGPAETSR